MCRRLAAERETRKDTVYVCGCMHRHAPVGRTRNSLYSLCSRVSHSFIVPCRRVSSWAVGWAAGEPAARSVASGPRRLRAVWAQPRWGSHRPQGGSRECCRTAQQWVYAVVAAVVAAVVTAVVAHLHQVAQGLPVFALVVADVHEDVVPAILGKRPPAVSPPRRSAPSTSPKRSVNFAEALRQHRRSAPSTSPKHDASLRRRDTSAS